MTAFIVVSTFIAVGWSVFALGSLWIEAAHE